MVGVVGYGVRVVEKRKEWRVPCLLYTDLTGFCVMNQKFEKIGRGIWQGV